MSNLDFIPRSIYKNFHNARDNVKYAIIFKLNKSELFKKINMEICCKHKDEDNFSLLSECVICPGHLTCSFKNQVMDEFDLIVRNGRSTIMFLEKEEICDLVTSINEGKNGFPNQNIFGSAIYDASKMVEDENDFLLQFKLHLKYTKEMDKIMNKIFAKYTQLNNL
jgi:hypothetical protein